MSGILVDRIALRTGRRATWDPLDNLQPSRAPAIPLCLLAPRNQGDGERVIPNTALAAQS